MQHLMLGANFSDDFAFFDGDCWGWQWQQQEKLAYPISTVGKGIGNKETIANDISEMLSKCHWVVECCVGISIPTSSNWTFSLSFWHLLHSSSISAEENSHKYPNETLFLAAQLYRTTIIGIECVNQYDVRLISIGMHETQYENMLFTWNEIKIPENVERAQMKYWSQCNAWAGGVRCATLWIGNVMRYHVHMRFGLSARLFFFLIYGGTLCEPTSSACDECCRKSKSRKKTQMKRRIPEAKIAIVRLLHERSQRKRVQSLSARFAGDAD